MFKKNISTVLVLQRHFRNELLLLINHNDAAKFTYHCD